MIEDGGARLESAEADLLRSVRTRFQTAGIAAFVARGANTSMSGIVGKSEARLHRLSALEHSGW